jgi:outer membrane protein OmpA-like peptidoglycan-associated protein
MAMHQFGKVLQNQESLKETQQSLQETFKKAAQGMEESNQKILDQGQKNLETAQKTLQLLEQLSQKQGTGELTLFFQAGETKLSEKSLEYERLVRFVDFLARESKGRKILFVSIGSSSAVGKKTWNLKLAQMRAEYPKAIIDKYLINVPHEFFRVYGTGDMYSPKGISKKERERYQHTRLIALFDESQTPALPEAPPKK